MAVNAFHKIIVSHHGRFSDLQKGRLMQLLDACEDGQLPVEIFEEVLQVALGSDPAYPAGKYA